MVRTSGGLVRIAELAGKTVPVLSRNSTYIDARVQGYGVQELWEINLQRNQQSKTIFTTSGHRWFTRYVEKITTSLLPGDRLATVAPPAYDLNTIDAGGVRHGIVFGDGVCQPHKRAFVELFGPKNIALLSWFDGYRSRPGSAVCALDSIRVFSLPPFYKTLPTLSLSREYLAGFIAGLIAADGHVDKGGTVILNQRDRRVLEFVREAAFILGITTYGITLQMRKGYAKTEQPLHRIHFDRKSFPPSLLLMEDARERFAANPIGNSRLGWVVKSVVKTNQVESVFCADVPGEHAFSLDDGILTGNCFGCGADGDIIEWIRQTQRVGYVEAKRILGEELAKPDPAIIAARQAEQRRQRVIAAYRDRNPDCPLPDWAIEA